MNKFSTKKRTYHKPTILLEVIDYQICSMIGSVPDLPPGMMKNPDPSTSKQKETSPFGGSKPKYK